MGCLFVLVSLVTPRIVLFCMWIFTDYLARAYGSWFWPTLGFFFLPTTTIAYAVAQNELSTATGAITAAGVVVIGLGLVIDLGLIGGARKGRGWWGNRRDGNIARRPRPFSAHRDEEHAMPALTPADTDLAAARRSGRGPADPAGRRA